MQLQETEPVATDKEPTVKPILTPKSEMENIPINNDSSLSAEIEQVRRNLYSEFSSIILMF